MLLSIERPVTYGPGRQGPELALCLGYLRAGDTLVVWRLGRSLRHLVETVNALAGRGVAFASLHEGIDTTTSIGRLIFHIFAALAEFERELIAERAAVGRQAARAHPSRSSLPGPVMRPVTSPWPRSPGRWVSGVAPSTGRCSRRPDRNPREGYRDSSSAESSAPHHRRPRTYPLDLSSGLLRPLTHEYVGRDQTCDLQELQVAPLTVPLCQHRGPHLASLLSPAFRSSDRFRDTFIGESAG